MEFANDGWYGLNFHYLNYKTRLWLFHQLETLADKPILDPKAKIRLSYQLLKGMARFKSC